MAKKTNCLVNGVPKYRYRPVDPNCDQANFYGDSKKDAIRLYTEYMNKKNKSNSRNFISLFNDWLDVEKKPEIKPSSYNRYLSIKHTWIDSSPFSNYPIKEIDTLTIKKYLNDVEAKGSKSTSHRVYLLLASFFEYANGYFIDKNPMIKVSMPKYEPQSTKKYYTPDEVSIIDKKLIDNDEFIYLFALYTGLREGEILALKLNDIDIKNKTINVDKTLNRVKIDGQNKAVEGPPKTKASLRSVPIKDSLIPLLERHNFVEMTKFNKLGLKRDKNSYFFSNSQGRSLRGDRLNQSWKSTQVKIGIAPIKFHSLRHTYCTLLARAGVRLEVAAKLMGHDKIETTAEIYIHVSKEDKKEAVEAINSIPSGDILAI